MNADGAHAAAPELHVDYNGAAAHDSAALLVHGFMSSTAQWTLNRPALSEHVRFLAVDLPGHGRSAAPDDPAAYRPAAVTAAFERIRAERGIERWFVIGHSMGGAHAVRYALEHPDRVRALVFTNSRAMFREREPSEPSEPSLRALDSVEERRALPFHPIHARRFPTDLRERMIADADRMTADAIRHTAAAALALSSLDRFAQLAVPTLLVNGRFESSFQSDVVRARQLLPSLEIVDLDGGHSINIERPDEFDAATIEFLRRH